MSLLTTKKLSSFESRSLSTNLPDNELIQERVKFAGGFDFNFADVLSGVSDVVSLNHTTFFLTDKINLAARKKYTNVDDVSSKARTKTTSLQSTSNRYYLIPSPVPSSLRNSDRVLYDIRKSNYPTPFNINFIDEVTCTVSCDVWNRTGTYFLSLSSDNTAILRKGYDVQNEDLITFNYITRSDRISLYRDIEDGGALMLTYNGDVLSGVRVNSTNAHGVIRHSCFAMTSQQNQTQDFAQSTDNVEFREYQKNTMSVQPSTPYKGLQNNYLISRNLATNSCNTVDALTLKNQHTDSGDIVKGNSLTLSAKNSDVEFLDYDMREYTSINKSIDPLHSGLSLNYTTYNKAYTILPGENIITTPESMLPFTRININDTKFIDCGSYSSTTPKFADKVYDIDTYSRDDDYIYLCTWLSGGDDYRVWVDRYFYPALLTKTQALTSNLAYTSYDAHVQNSVVQSNTLSAIVDNIPVFDTQSNLAFEPNKVYIYDRVDFTDLRDIQARNAYTPVLKKYYETIEQSRGFTFACNLLADNRGEKRQIVSKTYSANSFFQILWTDTSVAIQYVFYNETVRNYIAIQGFEVTRPESITNVVATVDHLRGICLFYINGVLVTNKKIVKTKAQTLYDDLYVEGIAITDAFNSKPYISDVFISLAALNESETDALSKAYNMTHSKPLKLTLPVATVNNKEEITEINTLNTNRGSKSSDVDVYISGTGIGDELKMRLIDNITNSTSDILPMNTNINNFYIK